MASDPRTCPEASCSPDSPDPGPFAGRLESSGSPEPSSRDRTSPSGLTPVRGSSVLSIGHARDGARRPRPPLRAASSPTRSPGPGRCSSPFAPAASAAPTSTRRRRAARPEAPARPRPPDRRPRRRRAATLRPGDRVGVPWLGWTCGECRYCPSGRENLCDRARFTGYHARRRLRGARGRRRALLLPDPGRLRRPAGGAAPLRGADRLPRAAAGRATRERLGLYGFGAAAHIVAQVARHQGRRVFAFTRAGRRARRRRSRASSAPSGRATPPAAPPEELDAAIIFAPAGELVPAALARGRARAAPSSAPGST